MLTAAAAEESADDARLRAEQQLSRTEDIAAYCDATQKQLQQAIYVVTATSCVVHLAGFFSSLAAATSRAGRTAERVEARCADTQSRCEPYGNCKTTLMLGSCRTNVQIQACMQPMRLWQLQVEARWSNPQLTSAIAAVRCCLAAADLVSLMVSVTDL